MDTSGDTAFRRILEPTPEQTSEIANGIYLFGLDQLRGEAPSRVAIVCEAESKVIGGAVAHALLGRFYLTQLWVAEEHRSRGLGTELVRQAEAIARERECADMVVDTLNARAVKFYEKLGFSVHMINRNYVRGFDWCFLIKEIGMPVAGRAMSQTESRCDRAL